MSKLELVLATATSVVAAFYVVASVLALLLPKGSKGQMFFATVAADLRGLVRRGRDDRKDPPDDEDGDGPPTIRTGSKPGTPPTRAPGGALRLALTSVAMVLGGCSSLVASRPVTAYVAPPERCASLSDRNATYTVLAGGFALAGGGAGLSTVATDSRELRTGLAIGAVVSAAAAAAFGAGAKSTANTYIEQGCAR